MKIHTLKLNRFMLFEDAEINWSKNINVICGENSTGKTTPAKGYVCFAETNQQRNLWKYDQRNGRKSIR